MVHHSLVFDQYVPAGTIASAGMLTSVQHNSQLGKHNILELHATLDNITPDPTNDRYLMIFVEHSGDGINWLQRGNQFGGHAFLDLDLPLLIAANSRASVGGMWSDQCLGSSKIQGGSEGPQTGPLLAFVRLYVCFDNATTAGHLKIFAAQRDA